MDSEDSKIYKDTNIFAKILRKELEADYVAQNEHCVVIKDKYPDAEIHNLVLPRGAYIDMRDFCKNASVDEKLSFLDMIGQQLDAIDGGAKVLMNVGKDGGQCVFHLHAHVLGFPKKS